MMTYGDIGIKDVEDLLRALEAGASAVELHDCYGDRIAGLMAAAVAEIQAEFPKYRARLADIMAAKDATIAELRGKLERARDLVDRGGRLVYSYDYENEWMDEARAWLRDLDATPAGERR